NDDGLDGYALAEFQGNETKQVGLNLFDGMAGKHLGAILRADDVLKDQARIVLKSQVGGEGGNHEAALDKANGREDGSCGEVAIGAVYNLGANDEDRHIGCAENGLC